MSLPLDKQQKAQEKLDLLKKSKFKQQNLPAWRPPKSFMTTIISFVTFGIIFIILGLVLIINNDKAKEFKVRYDDQCGKVPTLNCTVNLEVNETLFAPVYVYYELTNFYQNHRTYVKSRSQKQLNGQYLSASQIESDCDPIVKNSNLDKSQQRNINGIEFTEEELDQPAIPCGLIAKSYFNDEFHIPGYNIDPTGIAWKIDKDHKFKNIQYPPYGKTYDQIQWVDMTDERFIVWMRTAGLPDFKKLWGVINSDIEKGTYSISIDHNYDTSSFEGEKYFVLAILDDFGQKNNFLSICYLVFGSILMVFAGIFFLFHKYDKKGNKSN